MQIQLRVDPTAAIRWEELDRLPGLTELAYTGRDPRLPEYLARRPGIRSLSWGGHGQRCLDFSDGHLEQLSFDASGALEVRLPRSGSVRSLALAAPKAAEAVRVVAPGDGAGIYLMIGCQDVPDGPAAIPGLEALRALSVFHVTRLELERLRPYGALEELSVAGPPGEILDIERLAQFPRLAKLMLRDCYHLGADRFPARVRLPGLRSVSVDGVRQAEGALLKERLAGLPELSLRGQRTDAWLRANLDNPFREWPDDYGDTAGRAAMAAFRTALTALEKPATRADAAAIRDVLQAFVDRFNRLSARAPFDTIQREQVADGYDELAGRVMGTVPLAEARAWFDEWDDM